MLNLDAREACSALIDIITNGLKSVLSITEIKYEHVPVRSKDDKIREPRIQNQRRKLFTENINDRKRRYTRKININSKININRSMRQRGRSVYFLFVIYKYLIFAFIYFHIYSTRNLYKYDKRCRNAVSLCK